MDQEEAAGNPIQHANMDSNVPPIQTIVEPDARLLSIVQEFQYLLEKSQQLFAGLRDLPPTGRNWQPYFQRTFEVYTRLWKFQQQNRPILEDKEYYGLKRWEIGEIASKIGQLYYHYYLRTSETNYLHESFIFYEAIRDRQYFKSVLETRNATLMIKKLRYYARFIVVCLLLNKKSFIKVLIEELSILVSDYAKVFNNADSAEWSVVLSEITTFLEAERKIVPIDVATKFPFTSMHCRLPIEQQYKIPRSTNAEIPVLKLKEAIVVGNNKNQIKFSELTLDMYRIIQSLERELLSKPTDSDEIITEKHQKLDMDDSNETERAEVRRSNPHKYLLFRPSIAQLLLYLSTAFKDCCSADSSSTQNELSAILLYLSADGSTFSASVQEESKEVKSDSPLIKSTVDTEESTTVDLKLDQKKVDGVNATPNNAFSKQLTNQQNVSIRTGYRGGITTAPLISSRRAVALLQKQDQKIAENKQQITTSTEQSTEKTEKKDAGTSNIGGNATPINISKDTLNGEENQSTPARSAIPTGLVSPSGIALNSKHGNKSFAEVDCLHPYDLLPFTRKPLFAIVDSNNSLAFKSFPQIFGFNAAFLLSPEVIPEGSWSRGGSESISSGRISGSLYTLFLHSPMKAFAIVSELTEFTEETFSDLQTLFIELERAIIEDALNNEKGKLTLHPVYSKFFQDDFLRSFISRHLISLLLLSGHNSFRNKDRSLPQSVPELLTPIEIIGIRPQIGQLILAIVQTADVESLYSFDYIDSSIKSTVSVPTGAGIANASPNAE